MTKVPPVLRIGFTGHRDLSAADPVLLRARLREVLQAIAAAAPPQTPLRGVSALAIGADSIAAHAVLAAGWSLAAALPFPRDRYREDFNGNAEKREYDALLARAASVQELEGFDGGDAYRAVGAAILDQSDLLLAIWDGQPGHGPGGTAEVVRDARARAMPVLVIESTPPHALRLLAQAGDGDIAGIVTRLLAGAH